MNLVPIVCDRVSIPVIAAGGIADGRGIAAALMLGACGVQVGTAFLVARECAVHQNYKDKILKARDIDTIVTGRRLGHPVRSLKTAFSREFAARESDARVTNEELEAFPGPGRSALPQKRATRKGDALLPGRSRRFSVRNGARHK
jgi:enoyl-[acyl-carrier protein] reductase II